MEINSLTEILNIIIISLFLLGTITFVIGIIILLTRTMGNNMRAITKQTNLLAQKGLVDDLSGLVGNASAMMTATSQMVRTTAGIGLMLVFLGLLQVAGAVGLILYLQG